MDRAAKSHCDQLPRTDCGRAFVQCTSYTPIGTYWTQVSPHYPQPQLHNNNNNRDSTPNQEPRRSDEAIDRMLHDDQQVVSLGSEGESCSGTATTSGIELASRTSTSLDEVNGDLAQLNLSSSVSSSTSSDSEDNVPRRKVPDMSLRKLSSKLGVEWEKLATFLGFDHISIQRFKYNLPQNLEDQIFLMLVTWRCTKANRATSRRLADALKKCGRTDLANEITDEGIQLLEQPCPPRSVPNQMFNNLLASLTELTEEDRAKLAILIRTDILTGDGASLTGQNGKPPTLMDIIQHLEINNYLDANNVWYLMYLLKQLDKKDLYDMVWKYAMKQFKKHETLFLHEPSKVKGKDLGVLRFKVIGRAEHFGGMHLEEFKTMLATKFDGEVRHINKIGAKDGCIELFFQVPEKFMEKIVVAAVEEAEWFRGKNVMLVEAEGENAICLQEKPENEETAELCKEMQLLLAIINHDKQELEQLLTDGACPQFKAGGKWLLQWAIFMDYEKDNEAFVELLLEHGADQFAEDEMGMTAAKESSFLGRCRRALTFTPKKPTQLQTEDSLQFIPNLTSDNLETHSMFLWEKRQFVCIPCKKIWQEVLWGNKPYSSCKRCGTDYYPRSKVKEYPRRLVECKSCDIVFTTFRHPDIPKHCRHCRKVVMDYSSAARASESLPERRMNAWSSNPLPRFENVTKFLESLVHMGKSFRCDKPQEEWHGEL